MDDFAKSAFLWALRDLKESGEVTGICCAVACIIDPVEEEKMPVIWSNHIPDIFPLFQQMFDGFSYCYDRNGNLTERTVAELGDYWFFPTTFIPSRESLIHCLLSHSPM